MYSINLEILMHSPGDRRAKILVAQQSVSKVKTITVMPTGLQAINQTREHFFEMPMQNKAI